MHWWALIGVILAMTAFMGDLGMLEFPRQLVVPALAGGSPTYHTLFLFLIVFGVLGRMLQMERRREKETLRERVATLQKRVEELEKEKPGQ